MSSIVKQKFAFDFGQKVVEFANLNLGELRGLNAVFNAFKSGNAATMEAFTDLLPYIAKSAQRVDASVKTEDLEQMIDLFNLLPLIEKLIANSYPTGGGGKGEPFPVQ